MSKFATYAHKADDAAQAAFKEMTEKRAAFEKAEAARRATPVRGGMVDAQYAAKAARAEADYQEAKAAWDNVRRNVPDRTISQLAAIRKELDAAVAAEYRVNPEQIDSGLLELLKSGIMKADEYADQLAKAQNAGNVTMARLIGKYAQDAADATAAKYGQNDHAAQTLRAIVYQSRNSTGSAYLEAYDVMADVVKRGLNNPGMIDYYNNEIAAKIDDTF